MELDQARWGLFFAAFMYILGNGIWANHMVRRRLWAGWLLWIASAALVLVIASLVESRLAAEARGLFDVEAENHWIAVSLYALLSFPAAAAVHFRQSRRVTRLAMIVTAAILFLPAWRQLPEGASPWLAVGVTAGVCGFLIVWQLLLDADPEKRSRAA